jgi:hypothetical protein
MAYEPTIARYGHWYKKLLRFYSGPHRERFVESMEQTFNDLCRGRAEAGERLFVFVLWVFVETFVGIIRDNARVVIMQNKNIIRIALSTAAILLLPLLAMQFTDEVVWDLVDFVIAGALLFGTGLTYELVARKGGTNAYRAAVGVAVAAALLLVWMNLAVGLIGNEENPANLMYAGVLVVGLIGAFIARFQPREMARALFATALAQVLVPVIAMTIWRPPITGGLVGVFFLNTFFVVLWVVSALLFRHAGNAFESPTC